MYLENHCYSQNLVMQYWLTRKTSTIQNMFQFELTHKWLITPLKNKSMSCSHYEIMIICFVHSHKIQIICVSVVLRLWWKKKTFTSFNSDIKQISDKLKNSKNWTNKCFQCSLKKKNLFNYCCLNECTHTHIWIEQLY